MVQFPPVTVLLRGCLPFQDGDDLLLKLAATYGEAAGCTAVSLARWDRDIAHVEFFARSNGADWDEFHVDHRWVPVVGDLSHAKGVATADFPASGTTFDLMAAGQIVGWLNLVHPAGVAEVPRDWLDQTSRLVFQAGLWQESLRRQKLAALAEYAAGAGHEINNPLGAISGRVQQLLLKETNPERRRLLETIGGQALRIRDMIGDSMLFARPPAPEMELVSWSTVWEEMLDRFQPELQSKKLEVSQVGDGVTLKADPNQLRIVCAELLRNSLNACETGGQIACQLSASGGMGRVVVSDNGCGLTEKERVHLFDPFYSGREAGRGLGFGLSKVWQIVQQHGGQIRAHTPDTGGVEMHLQWPTG